MDAIYDIFEHRPAGAMWVESFIGLTGITERLIHLYSQRSGKYFVYSVHHAKIVAEFPQFLDDMNTGLLAAGAPPVHDVAPGNPSGVSGANGNGGHSATLLPGGENHEPVSEAAGSSDFLPPE